MPTAGSQQTGSDNQNWHVYAGTMDNSNQANFWYDGTQLAVNNTGGNANDHNPDRIQLNGYTGNNETSNSQIAQVLIFNRSQHPRGRERGRLAV